MVSLVWEGRRMREGRVMWEGRGVWEGRVEGGKRRRLVFVDGEQ